VLVEIRKTVRVEATSQNNKMVLNKSNNVFKRSWFNCCSYRYSRRRAT